MTHAALPWTVAVVYRANDVVRRFQGAGVRHVPNPTSRFSTRPSRPRLSGHQRRPPFVQVEPDPLRRGPAIVVPCIRRIIKLELIRSRRHSFTCQREIFMSSFKMIKFRSADQL